jgi:Fe2+ transport system protein B
MVALAVLAWRVLGAAYGLYALAALAIPMALPSERLGGLYSFPRFALVAFPCLAALAVLGRDRRVHLAAVAVLAAGLAVGVVRWALWYWVA